MKRQARIQVTPVTAKEGMTMTETSQTAALSEEEHMSTTQHVAILNTKGIGRNGQLIEYATDAQALAAIEQFGHAVNVERVEDALGVVLYQVVCADQRGARGSYRMHSIACAHRIPVYCP